MDDDGFDGFGYDAMTDRPWEAADGYRFPGASVRESERVDGTSSGRPPPGLLAAMMLRDLPDGAANRPLSPTESVLVRQAIGLLQDADRLIGAQRRRIAHLERLTTTDPLTGLLNRRGFDDAFARALANADRHGETGLVALIDFNRFKTVNDTLGHAVGDALLRRFAEVIGAAIRTTDVAARLGGDEFALLLTHASPRGGADRVHTIKREVNASALTWNGRDVPLDIAIGFVAYGPGDTADRLLRHADRALYRDKGRR